MKWKSTKLLVRKRQRFAQIQSKNWRLSVSSDGELRVHRGSCLSEVGGDAYSPMCTDQRGIRRSAVCPSPSLVCSHTLLQTLDSRAVQKLQLHSSDSEDIGNHLRIRQMSLPVCKEHVQLVRVLCSAV